VLQRISHYRVVEQIGEGGMGVVYRAHDEHLERDVALKVLTAGALADEAARRRFRQEALALAKLNHPNIGTVYEFDRDGERDFLAMELVAGPSLNASLSTGPLDEKTIVALGLQLADGLHAAHTQGIVHRDLKPSNLQMASDGRLKILDFGLAQHVHNDCYDMSTASLEGCDGCSGTVPYMAPEQLRGDASDARSDIYAAGAVLYEMATGKRLFAGHTGPVLIAAILAKDPAPPSRENPRISRALERVILKALHKEPRRRHQSAKELHRDVEKIALSPKALTRLRDRVRAFMGQRFGAS
jgi:eukaryotic-like serine/threonine-protein kinase